MVSWDVLWLFVFFGVLTGFALGRMTKIGEHVYVTYRCKHCGLVYSRVYNTLDRPIEPHKCPVCKSKSCDVIESYTI